MFYRSPSMKLFDTAFKALKTMAAISRRNGAGAKPDEIHVPVSASPSEQTAFLRKVDLSQGVPHYNQGMILERRGKKEEAIHCYREAIKAVPAYFDAHANLARLLCEIEKWDEAIQHCEAALRLKTNSPRVHNNFATALYQKGNYTEAVKHCTIALRLAPDDAVVYQNLTDILKHHPELQGTEAVTETKLLFAQLADKNYTAGFQLIKEDKVVEALQRWRDAAKYDPDWAELLNNMAWILATHPDDKIRNGKEALDLAKRANKLVGDKMPRFMDTLAAAQAEMGRYDEARRIIERALPLAKANGPLELAEKLPERLIMYRECKPMRESLAPVPKVDEEFETGHFQKPEPPTPPM